MKDGLFQMYKDGTKVWSITGTTSFMGLQFKRDGNLAIYSADYELVWSSKTSGSEASLLIMQDDGNLVLYGKRSNVTLWASNTIETGKLF